jgi:hypothetical protein
MNKYATLVVLSLAVSCCSMAQTNRKSSHGKSQWSTAGTHHGGSAALMRHHGGGGTGAVGPARSNNAIDQELKRLEQQTAKSTAVKTPRPPVGRSVSASPRSSVGSGRTPPINFAARSSKGLSSRGSSHGGHSGRKLH